MQITLGETVEEEPCSWSYVVPMVGGLGVGGTVRGVDRLICVD